MPRESHPEVEVTFDGDGTSVAGPFDLWDGQAIIYANHNWDGQEHFMVKLVRMDGAPVLGGLVVNEANTMFRHLEYVRAEGIVRVRPGAHLLQVKANPGSQWSLRVFQPGVR